MCEIKTRADKPCTLPPCFWVKVATVPQALGPNGAYGHEGPGAGRNILACAAHLARAVTVLASLPIRRLGADVRVEVYKSRETPVPFIGDIVRGTERCP